MKQILSVMIIGILLFSSCRQEGQMKRLNATIVDTAAVELRTHRKLIWIDTTMLDQGQRELLRRHLEIERKT